MNHFARSFDAPQRGDLRCATPARLNPFAASRVEALAFRFPEGWDWPALLDRLAALDLRAALVGPEGHGKTTLLEQLGERLASQGFVPRRASLRRGQRRLPAPDRRRLLRDVSPRDVLLIDGAQELGRWAWWRLRRHSRRAGGLVITCHQQGLLPTLLRCETSPELLEDLVAELLGAESRAELGGPELPGFDLAAVYRRHGGNVREALWELYDRWAAGGGVSPRARSTTP